MPYGVINSQIKGLFVGHAGQVCITIIDTIRLHVHYDDAYYKVFNYHHAGQDGETTLLTEVGAYCVQVSLICITIIDTIVHHILTTYISNDAYYTIHVGVSQF
jgi:hypothetical protein